MALDLPQPALLAAALILGLLVGSFLNVVAYRLPRQLQRTWRREALAWLAADGAAPDVEPAANAVAAEEPFNLVVPRSRCPCCGAGIAACDNIPVLSWLWLRGRCRHCAAPISWRYPLLELASGALAVLVVLRLGATPQALAGLLLGWSLLALAVIDGEHQLLPDLITVPLLWLGLLLNTAELFAPLASAVVGAAAGYLLLWSVYWLFRFATGREGMGYGDFKLLAALGAWFGWEALPALLLIASAGGALYGSAAILLRRQGRRTPFAFGPFLALAGGAALLAGERIQGWYELLG